MSPDPPPNPPPTKRKRLQGACDNCRRKKARCDSSVMPDKKCSNCIALGSECTHLYANQKHAQILNRTPLKTAVEGANSGTLGEYRDKMNGLLQAVLSSTYQAPSHPAILRDTLVSLARYSRALEEVLPGETWSTTPVPAKYEPPPPISGAGSGTGSGMDDDGDDSGSERGDDDYGTPSEHLKEALFLKTGQNRYYGASSMYNLLATALEFNKDYYRDPQSTEHTIEKYKRPIFWESPPWEVEANRSPTKLPTLTFPDTDLIDDLVELYFTKVNPFLPFLHRPTFEHSVKARVHLNNHDFGMCLLGVCALASRFSDDRRVFDRSAGSDLSCGYHWFRQVEDSISITKTPTLYAIQTFLLASLYASSSSSADKTWYFIGLAVRAALEIGLHRPPRHEFKPTVQTELRNRLWWALTLGECFIAISTGRPSSIQPWDFNVDLPIECDDEFWDIADPFLAFKQPPGRPSSVTHFGKMIELFNILWSAQRSLFAARNNGREVDPDCEDRPLSLAAIDHSLHAWEKAVPSHLRVETRHRDTTFQQQAGSLWMAYHFVQIVVHQPFISRKQLRLPSLEACTNAARACSRIVEAVGQPGLGGVRIFPVLQMFSLSNSAIVLLLNLWRRELSGTSLEKSEEIKDIHRCINAMKTLEGRNPALGRQVDLLLALLTSSKLPLPPHCAGPPDTMAVLHPDLRSAVAAAQKASHGPPMSGVVSGNGMRGAPGPSSGPGGAAVVQYQQHHHSPGHEEASKDASWLDLLTDPYSLRPSSSPTTESPYTYRGEKRSHNHSHHPPLPPSSSSGHHMPSSGHHHHHHPQSSSSSSSVHHHSHHSSLPPSSVPAPPGPSSSAAHPRAPTFGHSHESPPPPPGKKHQYQKIFSMSPPYREREPSGLRQVQTYEERDPRVTPPGVYPDRYAAPHGHSHHPHGYASTGARTGGHTHHANVPVRGDVVMVDDPAMMHHHSSNGRSGSRRTSNGRGMDDSRPPPLPPAKRGTLMQNVYPPSTSSGSSSPLVGGSVPPPPPSSSSMMGPAHGTGHGMNGGGASMNVNMGMGLSSPVGSTPPSSLAAGPLVSRSRSDSQSGRMHHGFGGQVHSSMSGHSRSNPNSHSGSPVGSVGAPPGSVSASSSVSSVNGSGASAVERERKGERERGEDREMPMAKRPRTVYDPAPSGAMKGADVGSNGIVHGNGNGVAPGASNVNGGTNGSEGSSGKKPDGHWRNPYVFDGPAA